ncbi:hypothetical protein [Aeromicrobium fastidiosum]|uniref:Uncharacterized protein n=1 Tax=Aeromicrobium fastidiosum TaxID=52699 RepID=A0A641APY8_9ACTN|nr:hypothetical protein [Aeromicrobium fastidiosum]KAA1378315.1 hypothetical protein ESP62_008045 [Aeromicrobium fastidiosum]MBP2392742.1 hypothetical protein [Aeromicrobium fastidiosum]
MAEPTTIWAAVAAIATVVGAVGALWTLIELKRDSRDRTRPMMTAELVPAVLTDDADLQINNRGPSPAVNVRVTFDPPLPVLEGADAEGLGTPFLQRRYASPIPTITPGMLMTNYWNSAVDDREPVPNDFTVRFDYADVRGRYYSDTYHLSLTTLRNQSGSYPANTDPAGLEKRRIKALEAIARGVGRP